MAQSLQELVKTERARLGLSVRQVAERSGGRVSPSAVHAVEKGLTSRHDEKTLAGLARGLALPTEVVDQAAGQPVSDDPGPFRLPKKADRLTRRERDLVLELVEVLLARRSR